MKIQLDRILDFTDAISKGATLKIMEFKLLLNLLAPVQIAQVWSFGLGDAMLAMQGNRWKNNSSYDNVWRQENIDGTLIWLIGRGIIRRQTKLAALVLETGTAERSIEGAVGEKRIDAVLETWLTKNLLRSQESSTSVASQKRTNIYTTLVNKIFFQNISITYIYLIKQMWLLTPYLNRRSKHVIQLNFS